ncbi:phage scaffolding protein [Paenibacillus sp. YYML68]|uniref:phage scaffolding protein n=1 Tax=Paenibacillus sp. YYML68 TaxID=2909250 RepID=UPI002491E39A|nr:phage scaffolding protein [Paenibacillus sp. YYML68]
MDWLKKLLEAQGLTAEQIKAITEGVDANYKGWVPKERYEEATTAKNKAEADLKDRDKQLEDLKKAAGDSATLKQQIEQLQADNKTAKEKYDANLKELRLGTAMKLALVGKVHDPDIVTSLLDKSKIELDDNGNVKVGLEDQIKALRESKAFLFVQEKQQEEQYQFKGVNPFDGKDKHTGGGAGGTGSDFGKRVADYAKQNDGLDKARTAYFE